MTAAYRMGFWAHENFRNLKQNPFRIWEDSHDEWRNGWIKANDLFVAETNLLYEMEVNRLQAVM